MKAVGHVATALIAATPIIYFRGKLPASFEANTMSVNELLWWVGLFSVLPDTDIILQKYLPIKHRGYFSHSILTITITILVLLTLFLLGVNGIIPEFRYLTPFSIFLAGFSVLIHLLGDSLTKTGVPILIPKKNWHFPYIGGYAAYDNIFLNLIPILAAACILDSVLGIDSGIMRSFGKFRDFKKAIETKTKSAADKLHNIEDEEQK
jgi:membrane-bound metal-dependent hydrolase YbcI (DUF457 family)